MVAMYKEVHPTFLFNQTKIDTLTESPGIQTPLTESQQLDPQIYTNDLY
jgi:hypothetical protein